MSNDKLAQLFSILSYIMFTVAGASFVFAVYCLFRFNIVKIINDLTGRTAKRSIARRRQENEKTGGKSHRPTPLAQDRGPTTDKIKNSQKLPAENATTAMPTAPAAAAPDDGTELLVPENTVKNDDSSAGATDVLAEATEVLVNKTAPEPETEVLSAGLEMVQSIVLIHTDEVI